MKKVLKFELTEEEKKAIKKCVETIDCDEFDCYECPFNYSQGCMLETLREIADED